MESPLPRNPSLPVAVNQQESVSFTGLSHFNTDPGAENISIFAGPGQRMGVSLFAVKGQIKVANVAADGLAKSRIALGDTILEVNGRRILTEREANKAMVEATGEIVLKVVKRNRSTASDSDDSEDSTQRTVPPTDRGCRTEPATPTPRTSVPKKIGRILSFGRRKPAQTSPQTNV